LFHQLTDYLERDRKILWILSITRIYTELAAIFVISLKWILSSHDMRQKCLCNRVMNTFCLSRKELSLRTPLMDINVWDKRMRKTTCNEITLLFWVSLLSLILLSLLLLMSSASNHVLVSLAPSLLSSVLTLELETLALILLRYTYTSCSPLQ
jgi:hypothetical protein